MRTTCDDVGLTVSQAIGDSRTYPWSQMADIRVETIGARMVAARLYWFDGYVVEQVALPPSIPGPWPGPGPWLPRSTICAPSGSGAGELPGSGRVSTWPP
jgi:hypothetical protein